MKRYFPLILVISVVLFSCSTGKKALQKGDYFSAVLKAVDRLKSSPENKNAMTVLRDGYPLAIEWSQEELDKVLSVNEPFKWSNAVNLMEQVNGLADAIRQTPAARKIIPDPKAYISELNSGKERAAEEQYLAAEELMKQETREAAREAFEHYVRADQFIPGYRDVTDKLTEAKAMATLTVVLEAIPVHAQAYELSSNFFYNQVFEYLNKKFPQNSFVNFYSPEQAERTGLDYPDMIVRLEFYDFVVGQINHSEKEEELKNRVRIETKDTTRVQYKTYTAKLKTFTDKVTSGGVLDVKVVDYAQDKLLINDRVPGSFVWTNDYAIYVGDKEALSKKQLELTERKTAPIPSGQDLFIEFTKPIYDQLTGKLNSFFRKYN
ncbi:MAG: hypothetical protein JW833_16105 [Prolixibacteraceae bacterium]|nr:hypothetical protein [Prolixibacteraceae bacterium]